MRARIARFTAVFQAVLLSATLILPALVAATEIWTDLWVYQSGDTVTVTGVDFGANEVVNLVSTDPEGTVVDTGTATTDDAGGFTYQFILNATMPGIYDIVATGQTSGLTATTQFDPVGVTITSATFVWYTSSFALSLAGTYDCSGTSGMNACNDADDVTVEVFASDGGNNTVAGSPVASRVVSVSTPGVNQPWSTSISFPGDFPVPDDGEFDIRATFHGKLGAAARTGGPAYRDDYFGVDTANPTSTINAPAPGTSDVDADGTVSDATSGPDDVLVQLYSGACPGTTLLDSDTDMTVNTGNWSVNNLSGGGTDTPGTYCIRSTATDDAGNVQSPATSYEYTINEPDEAPSVIATSPEDNATDVPVGTDIDVTFDEDVTVDTGNGITVECPSGAPIAGSISGSGNSWTFDPTSDLPASATCVVTVHFNQVQDVDTNDPPDTMDPPNYLFDFTTAAANTPPEVDAGGPYGGDEGEAIAISGSVNNQDGDVLTYLWTIDTTGIDAGGSCVIADDTALSTTVTCDDDSNAGAFTLTLTVSGDPAGDVDDDADLTVDNVAPTVALDGSNPTSVTESVTAVTYDYLAADAGDNDSLVATIDCGVNGTYVAASDDGDSFQCQFLDGGGPDTPTTSSDVTIYVTDDEGTDSATDTQTVDIANANPVVAAPSFSATTICQGSTATLTGISFSDAGTIDDPWGINIDWGDGSADYNASVATQGAQSNVSPTLNTPGTYTATVTVTDKDGGSGSNTSTNQVTVVAHYEVRFLQPVDGTTTGSVSNSVKLGRVVPIKVAVWDNCANAFAGAYVTDPATPVRLRAALAPTAGGSLLDAVEAYADAGQANNDTLSFRWTVDASAPGGGFWIYNLDTKNSSQCKFELNKTYRIDATIGGVLGADTDSQHALLKMAK